MTKEGRAFKSRVISPALLAASALNQRSFMQGTIVVKEGQGQSEIRVSRGSRNMRRCFMPFENVHEASQTVPFV